MTEIIPFKARTENKESCSIMMTESVLERWLLYIYFPVIFTDDLYWDFTGQIINSSVFSWTSVFIWRLKLTMMKRLLNIFANWPCQSSNGDCVFVSGDIWFEVQKWNLKTLWRAISDLSRDWSSVNCWVVMLTLGIDENVISVVT